MKLILAFIYLFCIHDGYSISTEGKCIRTLSNKETEWFCCDNKEDRDGICVDCLDGFLSEVGEKCHPCPKETYGRKCGETCNCHDYQRCDNIQGCLNSSDQEIVSTKTSDTSTHWISNDPIKPSEPIIDTSTHWMTSEPIKTSEQRVDASTSWKTNDPIKTSEPGFVILQTELVYIICTSVLILAVLMGMLWFRHFIKKRHRRDIRSLNRRKKMSQKIKQGLTDDTFSEELGVYDYIDDSQLEDIVKPIVNSIKVARKENRNFVVDSDFDSDDSTKSLNDGYLNPYQRVVPSRDSHSYSEPLESAADQIRSNRDITVTDNKSMDDEMIPELSSSSTNAYNDAMSAQSSKIEQLSSYISMHEPVDGQQIPE